MVYRTEEREPMLKLYALDMTQQLEIKKDDDY